jgi:hypothetical protein
VVLLTKSALEHVWMRSTFASGSAPLSPLLDVSVYVSCGNMRLTLNRKPFKPGAEVDKPWLRPVSRVGAIEFADTHESATPDGHHAFTLSLLQQHMWTTGSSGSLQLEERLREWKSGVCARIPARDADDDPPLKRGRRTGVAPTELCAEGREAPLVPASALALYAMHKNIPESSVSVVSNTLRVYDDTSALTGDVVVAAGATAERLHISSLGNVFISGANDAAVAAALVQRALTPSRAATFTDWYAVGGALHSVAPTRAMFDVWDEFSQLCPAKYTAKECAERWKNFNDKVSIGTLIHMAREDDAQETAAILRSAPSVFIGRIAEEGSPSAPVTVEGAPPPELSATRHLLGTVLGDVTSVPTTAGGGSTWSGSWSAPPGRRCCHGAVHEAPTTFETRVSYTHRCSVATCRGMVGGSFWSSRAACSACSTKHCTECQRAASPSHTCSAFDVARVARDRPTADGMVYETCHACSLTPAVLGPLRLAIPRTAPPVSADVYAPALAADHPSWALTPCPIFTCYHHVFLALFAITDDGRLEHGDGARRVLGITAESDVVMGVKRDTKPYTWCSVAHNFRDPLRAWFLREHAATAALLPPPEERPPRPLMWRLPCCQSMRPCGLKTCHMLTHEPWLKLRQLQAHGLLAADTPAVGV